MEGMGQDVPREISEDKVQSVAEYAPEIIDQLFHDEGLYMPRVNYMVPRICFGKTCCCLEQISGVMVGNGGLINNLSTDVNDGLRSVVWCFAWASLKENRTEEFQKNV